MNDENEGKFKIICQVCNSENCEVEDLMEYDYDEVLYCAGSYIKCNDCGNHNKY